MMLARSASFTKCGRWDLESLEGYPQESLKKPSQVSKQINGLFKVKHKKKRREVVNQVQAIQRNTPIVLESDHLSPPLQKSEASPSYMHP